MRKTFCLLVAVLAVSCSPAKRLYNKANDQLGDATKLFNDDVRWGYAEKGGDFVEAAKRTEFVSWRTKLDEKMEITDVHIDATHFEQGETSATVKVTWKFFRKDQMTEQTKSGTEHWSQVNLKWFVKFEPEAFP